MGNPAIMDKSIREQVLEAELAELRQDVKRLRDELTPACGTKPWPGLSCWNREELYRLRTGGITCLSLNIWHI